MIVAVLALPLLGVGDLAKHQTIFAMNQEQVDQALLRPARWPRLVLLRSDYRVMHEPLLKLIKQLADASPGRPLAVLLPEVVKTAWWQQLLHNHRARRSRQRLLRFGGSRLVLVNVPLYLDEPRTSPGRAPDRAPDRASGRRGCGEPWRSYDGRAADATTSDGG